MSKSKETPVYLNPDLEHTVAILFEVTNGNANGDPDRDNHPRVTYDGLGIVSDWCMKRWERDHWEYQGDDVYVSPGNYAQQIKETLIQTALDSLSDESPLKEVDWESLKAGKKGKNGKKPTLTTAQKRALGELMCKSFRDVRLFGDAGAVPIYQSSAVHGAFTFSQALSVDPVQVEGISGMCCRRASAKEDTNEDDGGEHGTGGPSRHIVRYGLYRADLQYHPNYAKRNGVTEEDLKVFWSTLRGELFRNIHKNRGQTITMLKVVVLSKSKSWTVDLSHPAIQTSDIMSDILKVSLKEGVDEPTSREDYNIVYDPKQEYKDLGLHVIDLVSLT